MARKNSSLDLAKLDYLFDNNVISLWHTIAIIDNTHIYKRIFNKMFEKSVAYYATLFMYSK